MQLMEGVGKMKTTKKSMTSPLGDHAAMNFVSVPAEVHRILPDGFSLGGWLEQLEAVGGGLVRVVVSDREYLVDDTLQEKLATLMGQHMSVGHYFGQWGCGAIPV